MMSAKLSLSDQNIANSKLQAAMIWVLLNLHALYQVHTMAMQAKDRKRTGIFDAPLYRSKRRTGLNYVANFPLRTDEATSKWTLRGAAMLGSID